MKLKYLLVLGCAFAHISCHAASSSIRNGGTETQLSLEDRVSYLENRLQGVKKWALTMQERVAAAEKRYAIIDALKMDIDNQKKVEALKRYVFESKEAALAHVNSSSKRGCGFFFVKENGGYTRYFLTETNGTAVQDRCKISNTENTSQERYELFDVNGMFGLNIAYVTPAEGYYHVRKAFIFSLDPLRPEVQECSASLRNRENLGVAAAPTIDTIGSWLGTPSRVYQVHTPSD